MTEKDMEIQANARTISQLRRENIQLKAENKKLKENITTEKIARKLEVLMNAECERCPIYRDCGYNGFQRCKDGWEYWLNRED